MSQSNYVEHVLFETRDDYNVPKTDFFNLLSRISGSKQSRNFTRYLYGDLVYECSNTDVKTYRKRPLKVITSEISASIKECHYNKENVPFYMFPSTTQLLDVVDVNCITIRFHGSIFLNFEIQTFSSESVYKIFINHNIDIHDDPDTVQGHITRAITSLM